MSSESGEEEPQYRGFSLEGMDFENIEVRLRLPTKVKKSVSQSSLSLDEWVQLAVDTYISNTSDSKLKLSREFGYKSVKCRMPKDWEHRLLSEAAKNGMSVSFLANKLIDDFLLATADLKPDLPYFEAPPPGRVPDEIRDEIEKLRNSLSLVQLRLPPESLLRLSQMARATRRSRGDMIGSALMHQLDK